MLDTDMSSLPAPHRGKRWLVIGFAVFGLGIIALIVAKWWVSNYLQSAEFKKELEERLGGKLRAKVELQSIKVEGGSIWCQEMHARGGEDAKFGTLDVRDIHAEIDFSLIQLLQRNWKIKQVEAGKMVLDLTTERLHLNLPSVESGQKMGRVDQVKIKEADVIWPGGGIEKLRMEILPEPHRWNITGKGGLVSHGKLPKAEVLDIRTTVSTDDFFLETARLAVEGGTLELVQQDNEIQILADKINITQFLPNDWRARLKGKVFGKGKLTLVKTGEQIEPQLTGKFRVENSIVEALPVLDAMALLLKIDSFRKMEFDQLSGELNGKVGEVKISNFVATSAGVTALRGEIVSKEGVVNGQLQLGVMPIAVDWLPGLREQVFNQEKEGFVWTPVQITGTPGDLQEDLSARVVKVAKDTTIQKAEDTAGQAIDTGKKLFQKGLNELLNSTP